MQSIVRQLLASPNPAIRYHTRVGVFGDDAGSPDILALRDAIRESPCARVLLSARNAQGIIPGPIYRNYDGAHWVLAMLSEIGYPAGDATITPLVDQVCRLWLSPTHLHNVHVIEGRARRCASQEAYTLYAMLTLGFHDERADRLAELLLAWQWPDGGWNCDKRPQTATSSFHESWLPLRALARYRLVRPSAVLDAAIERAAEFFLSRRLFRRLSTGHVIRPSFLHLAFPSYWRYNILNGLRTMVEAGYIHDHRCAEALDLLHDKRLPDGGLPAEAHYLSPCEDRHPPYQPVQWSKNARDSMHEWVTVHALTVLHAGGWLFSRRQPSSSGSSGPGHTALAR